MSTYCHELLRKDLFFVEWSIVKVMPHHALRDRAN